MSHKWRQTWESAYKYEGFSLWPPNNEEYPGDNEPFDWRRWRLYKDGGPPAQTWGPDTPKEQVLEEAWAMVGPILNVRVEFAKANLAKLQTQYQEWFDTFKEDR